MQSVTIRDLELRRRVGGFKLGPLSLRLESGSRTALVGPSGCGKTSLLRCLAGFEPPRDGSIWIGDKLASNGRGIQLPPSDRDVGLVFQQGALWPHMTAVEHLRFVAPGLSVHDAEGRLQQVGLQGFGRRRPSELSGGEAQRVALARALACDPSILLLDEPLGSVDVHLRDSLALLVRRLADRHGLTVVVVTHDSAEALAIADDLVVMRDGQVVEQGSASELLRDPKTLFTARFLGGAVCVPIQREDRGFSTVFGPIDLPAETVAEHSVLAVLPHEVEPITSVLTGEGPGADVLNVRDDGSGTRIALVEVAGQSLSVACGSGIVPGNTVALRLRGSPRVMPRQEAS